MEDPSTVPRRRAEPPRDRYGQDRQLRDYAYEAVADVLESVDTDEFEGNIVYWGDGRLKFVVERLISDDDANARRFVNEASMVLFNDMVNCAISSRFSLMMKCAGTVSYNPSSGGRARAWCFNSHRANAEAEAAVPARRLGSARRRPVVSCRCGASHRRECVHWTRPDAPSCTQIAGELGEGYALRAAPATPPVAAGKRIQSEMNEGVPDAYRDTPFEKRHDVRAPRQRQAQSDDAGTEEHSADEGASDALDFIADQPKRHR
jgi:hypothetical protein